MDAWAARLTGNGVHHEVRRADQPVLHRGCGLERPPFLPQRRVETAANLGEPFWQHNMRLGTIHLDRSDPTGRHHGQVGPEAATPLCVGTGQRMFEQCQRP
jgi:hypothetical protein